MPESQKFLGFQLANAAGDVIQGQDGDPSKLTHSDIMTPKVATKLIFDLPSADYLLMPIFEGMIENPKIVSDDTKDPSFGSLILNDYQKHVLRTYADGDFAYLADQETLARDFDFGDTLLNFLMVELSTEEDCDEADVAIQRLTTARDDIARLIDILEQAQTN